MRSYTAVIERDTATRFYIGYIPGWPGAHSQATTLDGLHANLEEVITLLLRDGEPSWQSRFIGTQAIQVE